MPSKLKSNILLIISCLALITGACSLTMQFSNSPRTGYVLLGKVMQELEMKKEYELRLQDVSLQRKKHLDSLKFRIDNFYAGNAGKGTGMLDSLKMLYETRADEFNESNQVLAESYNKEVMDKINASIKAYAEDKGYDMVLGADGSGSLMYARETMDVTTDFVVYANDQYKKTK